MNSCGFDMAPFDSAELLALTIFFGIIVVAFYAVPSKAISVGLYAFVAGFWLNDFLYAVFHHTESPGNGFAALTVSIVYLAIASHRFRHQEAHHGR